MSEQMRMYVEVGFNVLYLLVVWGMTLLMSLRLRGVRAERFREANLFRWAFFLLALGDTGHVGFRVIAYALGGLAQNPWLVGVGALATAITVTFFYAMLLVIWRERFQGGYGWFEKLLFAMVPLRLVVMTFPQNQWASVEPPPFWGPFRNLFLIILGLGVMYLLLRDALKQHDRLYRWVAVCIFFSYLFYTPVIFFARQLPLLGMLMIPKTIMYVAIQFIAYYGLWPKKTQ
jgi:hypothetical protein